MDSVSLGDFWNPQLQFSVVLPRFQQNLSDMAARSLTFADGRSLERVTYGSDPRQWLEETPGTGPGELLPVMVHGGYWRALRAEDHRFALAGLLGEGATVANVEYRLMPSVRLADVVADVTAALRRLALRHPEARLLPVGHSAGAHLVLSALRQPDIAERCAGAIALSGVYDLRPLPHSFLQAEIGLATEEVSAHSLGPEEGSVPIVYANGADETPEFLRQSALMAARAGTTWRLLPGTDHMTLLPAACRPDWMAQSAAWIVKQGDRP